MTRPKLIHCSGRDPVSVGREYRVPWCDVWIRWAGRGREVVRLGPTLKTLNEVKADLIMDEECHVEHPDLNFTDDIERNRKMIAAAERDGFAHDAPHPHGIPNIVTARGYIDRAEAERMLRWFLADAYGFRSVRFKWKRVKMSHCVMPMGFGWLVNQEPEVESLKVRENS